MGVHFTTKILIVDAEPNVRSVVAKILERQGFEVAQAGQLQEALKILQTAPPALVITDMYLPGVTCQKALQAFKSYRADLPVLMISGAPDFEILHNWIGHEGFYVFPKPFTAQKLIAKVRQVLAQSVRRLKAPE